MKNDKTKKRWKEKCRICGKSHLWEIGKCRCCGAYYVPRLVSENVGCFLEERCDGCIAYSEHLI